MFEWFYQEDNAVGPRMPQGIIFTLILSLSPLLSCSQTQTRANHTSLRFRKQSFYTQFVIGTFVRPLANGRRKHCDKKKHVEEGSGPLENDVKSPTRNGLA